MVKSNKQMNFVDRASKKCCFNSYNYGMGRENAKVKRLRSFRYRFNDLN